MVVACAVGGVSDGQYGLRGEAVAELRSPVVEPRVVVAHDVGVIETRHHLHLPRHSLFHSRAVMMPAHNSRSPTV